MLLRSPDEGEFRTIFRKFAESQQLKASADLLDRFVAKHYTRTAKPFRRCHPRDVISQAVDYIQFRRLQYELTDDLLDSAFASCFPVMTELSET
jgi:hypothetical protein